MMPKLLTLTTPTVRNQRTLIWLRHQAIHNYSKWDAVVTSMQSYYHWHSHDAKIVGMVLLTLESLSLEMFLERLFILSKDVPLIFLPRSILSLKSEAFWADNFDNLMCLDTLSELYPFLGAPFSKGEEDAVALFAHLCRYYRLVDCPVARPVPFQVVHGMVPQEAWLVTQFFRPSDSGRLEELKECLRQNCACPYVDRIVLLNETDCSAEWATMPGCEKIKQVVMNKRLTYAHFLQFVNDAVPPHTFVILCNADIYMGKSMTDLWKVNMEDRLLALLRWDMQSDDEPILFGPRADSQDTWILLSDSVQNKKWPYATFDFPLGKAGCDNAFAGHMLRQRFLLCNPALTFRTYHLHLSGIRTYSKKDCIRSDLYINLVPTYLIDTKQETVPSTLASSLCNQLVPFEVRSSSLSNEITYCTMLEKEGKYKWEPTVENHYFEPAIPLYSWKEACVTPNGLVYTPYAVYTGKQVDDFPYWKGSTVDLFTPLIQTKQMMAIPFPDESVYSHRETYRLQYLSRCIRLRQDYPDASFWVPHQWKDDVMGLGGGIILDGMACYSEMVIGLVPGSSSQEIGHEEVNALRARLPAWRRAPTGKKCVVVRDDILTEDMIQRLASWLTMQGLTVVYYDAKHESYDSLVGASLCIILGGPKRNEKWSALWALPVDACVIELQQELALDGELQHLCHVSGWKSWILLLAKGSVSDVQDQVMEQLAKWHKKNSCEILFGEA